MAWRVDEPLLRGELDCRVRGRVTGRLWFQGCSQPVVLDLRGSPWRDLAGHLLRFTRGKPVPATGLPEGFALKQTGATGDLTASRKVRVPDCTEEELLEHFQNQTPFPWHWGNALYLEWFSTANGRVVIESSDFHFSLEAGPTWTLTEEEETAQREANLSHLKSFMEQLADAIIAHPPEQDFPFPEEDDPEPGAGERQADAEAARHDLLMDRVTARIEREGFDPDAFDRILEEEQARLRRERGEPEPTPLTPEEEAERNAWIEELNASAEEALDEAEAEDWKATDKGHPLVERARDLSFGLFRTIDAMGWAGADANPEHPIAEVRDGVCFASAKLAGALNGLQLRSEWPPDPLFAGNILVRLKKARGHLIDALAGLDAAERDGLAEAAWRRFARGEIESLLTEVRTLIEDARTALEDHPPED
ncbi:MAG: hypothetical protein EA425_12735 [Puniceicoccaceae bacterium]|nr:MAG: hypothetical protein EA425_12735 [Puniceicoccaceae bacterium]